MAHCDELFRRALNFFSQIKTPCSNAIFQIWSKKTVHKAIVFPSICLRNHVYYFKYFIGRPFVKRFALCYQTVLCPVCPVLSVTLVYFGQTLGRIKIKLGMQVGLGSKGLCVRWEPSSPFPQFSAHICCGQMAGWIKMPLGMEVGLGPGDFVLNGDPALLVKKGAEPPPNFGPMFLVTKRLDGSRWYLPWR